MKGGAAAVKIPGPKQFELHPLFPYIKLVKMAKKNKKRLQRSLSDLMPCLMWSVV